ncbi:MAG: MarR family transcriptional regulator [Alphaproteobacteria bacterium]|nr:MarR family transcriptional regulator [Alphaproteobacteria bacterium]
MRNPNQSFGFLVHEVARLLRRDFNQRAVDLGLSQAQWRALAYLSHHEGVRQVTLAEFLEIQPISLARQLDYLQENGLIERRPDPSDRRAIQLYLTPKAEPVLERLWGYATETRKVALADMPEVDHQALVTLLQRVKQNLLSSDDTCRIDDARAAESKDDV